MVNAPERFAIAKWMPALLVGASLLVLREYPLRRADIDARLASAAASNLADTSPAGRSPAGRSPAGTSPAGTTADRPDDFTEGAR